MVTRVAAPDGAAPDRVPRSWRVRLSRRHRPATRGYCTVCTVDEPAGTTDGQLMRNPELDRYLAAHKQFSNTSALATPGALVRNATVTVPDR